MASITNEYCNICESETMHNHMKCCNCEERKQRTEAAAWAALTTDEKLKDLKKRIDILESGEIRFY